MDCRICAALMSLAPWLPPTTYLSASSTAASGSTYSGRTSTSLSPGSTSRCRTRLLIDPSGGQLGALAEVRAELVVEHRQRRADGHVHVEVLVGAEAAAEEHHRLLLGQLAVLQQLLAVLGGVDRVVRLVADLGRPGVLVHDHRLALGVGVLALGVEVLELVDPGERDVDVVVVHHRGALEVVDLLDLGLEV